MKRRDLLRGVFAISAVAAVGGFMARAAAPANPAASPTPAVKVDAMADFTRDTGSFLAKHCLACHGNGKKRGDVSLEGYHDADEIQKDRDVWETVVEAVQTGTMPPKDRPRPAPEEVAVAVKGIDAVLAQFDCTGERNAGRVTLRRLNRNEYNNTIRDLVGVDFKSAADFPNDDVGYGFDNIGDVLSLSPLLFERYLAAAEDIFERAVVIAEPPKPVKAKLEGLNVDMRASDKRNGLGQFLHSRGTFNTQTYFDEGDYTFEVEAFAQQAGADPVRAALRINGTVVKEFEIRGEDRATAETFEAKTHLKGGTNYISLAFLNPTPGSKYEKTTPDFVGPVKPRRLLFLRKITIDGPYNSPPPTLPESHRRIMAHSSGLAPREAAREIVARFATKAFRRPLRAGEVDRLLELYDRAEKEGERFEDRVRLALIGVIVRPDFLFRVELDPADAKPGTSYLVNEYELASRLSYFLWSSMPDEELFALAAEGKLRQELDNQVRRMLKDPKSRAFVENFGGQWLTLGKLAYVAPDPKTFPGFDEELKTSMVRETELFFEALVREDRSILDVLDADFSFVNGRLAKHYGIEGVEGSEFRRVTLPANRGGVLTQASVLTLTSNPTRTSPVKRGKWVLDQILGTPPPPPPPDVPDLAEEKRLTGSLRKVMEMHREKAVCASCHQRMDPLGFAFENYDAVGAWRDRDGEFPIDPSGVLPGGRSFQSPAELKAILRGQKETFSRSLAEKVLTYAIGRGLEYYDRCAVDKILDALNRDGDRFSVLLAEAVKSEPFQMRTATGDER